MSSLLALVALVLSTSALLLNAVALVLLLNSWHLYRRGGGGGERKEKVGYLVFVFVLCANLMFVVSECGGPAHEIPINYWLGRKRRRGEERGGIINRPVAY